MTTVKIHAVFFSFIHNVIRSNKLTNIDLKKFKTDIVKQIGQICLQNPVKNFAYYFVV